MKSLKNLLGLSVPILALSSVAMAAEEATTEAVAGTPWLWWLAPISAIASLGFAWFFYKKMMEAPQGTEKMIEIATHVRQGAYAYLFRQYSVVTIVFVILMAVFIILAYRGVQNPFVAVAFLTGGFFSALSGFLGMKTAANASARTAHGASKSLNGGLQVAFRSGAVMGLVVVGLGLFYITIWYLILDKFVYTAAHMQDGWTLWGLTLVREGMNPQYRLVEITSTMITFGMGASTQALFARVGGGIYTKAADVGADLVGKVEAGIPEDDPRNPATIADNVGDYVGDVAGMGADLYESYCGSILAASALGAALAPRAVEASGMDPLKAVLAPMIIAGIGILLSIAGVFMVRCKEDASQKSLLRALLVGTLGSSILILIVLAIMAGVTEWISWGIFGSVVAGLISGVVIGQITEYYTSDEYKPTKGIAGQAIMGPATAIIDGFATGMYSSGLSVITIVIGILAAFGLAGGFTDVSMGLYGIGFAAVGMLSTLGITLATDAYGPIADNAGGNAEMSGLGPEVRSRTDALDSLGNTTAATGKGFAIGSAALTALALLAAYVEEVRVGQQREAMAYIQQQVPAAKDDAAAGMEEIYYIGYGKFAQKWKEGTGEGAYRGFMMLNHKARQHFTPGDSFPAMDLVEADPDNEFVRETPLKGHVANLVSTQRASLQQYMAFYDVTLMNPKVLCGMFCGVLLAFLFCALTMKAVGRAAYEMMNECRRQFDKMKAYLKGQGKDEAFANNPENWPRDQITYENQPLPDYANCVAISTAGAQKEMVFPSLLAIIIPIVVGLLFGVPGVMGLLAGGLSSGFAVAIFMANAGGAWDNAKKYIEEGNYGGKGSDNHKAAVIGDTVGDPFKDTSGPSMNILIKLMSVVSLVIAPILVNYWK